MDDSKQANLTILLVEDHYLNQLIAKHLLESKGYVVEIARTGKEALTMVNHQRYAAILMDIGLPDIDGIAVTHKIREAEKLTQQYTPIIALTANGYEAKQKCLDAGMDDFSLKPFDIEVLHQQIQAMIAQYPR